MKFPIVFLKVWSLRELALTPFLAKGGVYWLCFSITVTMPRDRR